MAEEWYRNPRWSQRIQADFESKLSRARASNRAQYLRIKGLTLLEAGEVDGELLEAAVSWTSAHVRTLDAIHLASALRIGAREMLVYDRRLAKAAEATGLEVISPGA